VTDDPIRIDCYGRHNVARRTGHASGRTVHFVYKEKPRFGSFHAAMFMNHASLGDEYRRYPLERRIALLLEPLASHPFRDDPRLGERYPWVFTHDAGLIARGAPYVEFMFGTNWVQGGGLKERYTKTKLISFIGNVTHEHVRYRLRREVGAFLSEDARADAFGRGIREIEYKTEGLNDYCFSVAMENIQQDYYFSEKFVDCLLTDTVPIYCGCPGIERYFDTRGMLRFSTMEELLEIIGHLSRERYEAMLPFVRQNKEKAQANRWHSYDSLFERVADEIVQRVDCRRAIRMRPVVFRVLEKARRLVKRG